jgi:hypothetical protein
MPDILDLKILLEIVFAHPMIIAEPVGESRKDSPRIPDENDKDSPESKMAKLFSIFTTPPAKSVLSELVNFLSTV